MKRRLTISSFLFIAARVASTLGDIVPPDRLAAWQGNVGVPGGIPNRTSIGATVNAQIYGNGITNATAAINAAINASGPGQVAYLPAGTYLVSSALGSGYKPNYSIRGAGQGQTIIKWIGGANVVFHFGSADWPYPTNGVPILAGATRGSTVLTVGATSTLRWEIFVMLLKTISRMSTEPLPKCRQSLLKSWPRLPRQLR